MKATWLLCDNTDVDGHHEVSGYALILHHEGATKLLGLCTNESTAKALCSILNSVLEEDRDALSRSIRTIFSVMGDDPVFAPDAIEAIEPTAI